MYLGWERQICGSVVDWRSLAMIWFATVLATTSAAHSATPSIPTPRPKPFPVTLILPKPATYGHWPSSRVEQARLACARLLRGVNASYSVQDPIGKPGGCGIAYPLKVSAVAGVKIIPPATLNCAMVRSLDRWFKQDVQPIASRSLHSRVIAVEDAASYSCRLRNGASVGKISEHAFGNAMDIGNFTFSNRVEVSVAGEWSGFIQALALKGSGNFLHRVRESACRKFNTVLGPGSDPYHSTHFHVDLMKLRPGRGKYCH